MKKISLVFIASFSGYAPAQVLAVESNSVWVDNGSNGVRIGAPDTLPSSYSFVLPSAPGSTGQVLTAADSDGNLEWTTPESTVVAAEGDLIVGDSGASPSRLAIGSAGKVLRSNGTTATWEDAGQILGVNTDTPASTGNVGEVVEDTDASLFSQSAATLNTWYDITGVSVTLDAGDWDVYATALLSGDWASGATSITSIDLGLRSGASTLEEMTSTGVVGDDTTNGYVAHFAWETGIIHKRVAVANGQTKTLKLSIKAGQVSGTGVITIASRNNTHPAKIWARRAR